jgi:hypothetical protein
MVRHRAVKLRFRIGFFTAFEQFWDRNVIRGRRFHRNQGISANGSFDSIPFLIKMFPKKVGGISGVLPKTFRHRDVFLTTTLTHIDFLFNRDSSFQRRESRKGALSGSDCGPRPYTIRTTEATLPSRPGG